MNFVSSLFVVASLAAVGCTVQPGTDTGSGQGGLIGALQNGNGESGGAASSGGVANGQGSPCNGQGIKVLAGCTAPQGTYVALGDQGEQQRIGDEMWSVMTGAQCWFLEGSSQQYVFYGQLQYTFWGMVSASKSGGTLAVMSIGRYEDKNAAMIRLRGEDWLLAIGDASTIYMAKSLYGKPYVETYRAHNDGRCT